MNEPRTRKEWMSLLSDRIEQSGLSSHRFARDVLRRDDRTIRGWLSGESPIPHEVQLFLVDAKPARRISRASSATVSSDGVCGRWELR